MASNQQERSVYLRAIRHYLAAILVSAILLLSFSLASLRFQKQSVNEVTPANLHFRGERLAFEIEAEILRLAGNCLRDLERLTANTSLDSERNPYTTADLMQELELLRDSHRIARRFFVLENGEVLFPPVRRFAPNPSRLAATNKEDLSHRRFERLFAEAENHEVREDGLEQALSGYRKCYELDVPESLKALALDQMAECLVKLGRPMEAARTYHRLGNYYADHYDKHWVPYKIVSGLALDAIQGGERSPLPQRLVDLHQELTRGRWALDAEQYEAVTSHIEKRLGKEASVLEGGHLLDTLSFGRAVQGASALEEIADPVRVYSNTILEDDAHYEVFCRAVSDGHQTNKKVIGFSLDIDWLTRYFVPEKQKSIVPDGTSVPFALALKSTLDGDSDELLHSDLRIPFPSILSLWELKLSEGAAAAWKAGIFREMFFVGGAVLMTLCILTLASILAIRITKEMHLLRVQSDFLGRISHELRTPLAIIKLYAESLSGGLSVPERQKCQQLIISETERLSRLVHALIDLARIQRGMDEFRIRGEDLGKVIRSVLETYGKMLTEQGFRITSAIEESVPAVRCDREKVSQAILNLLDNARKYSSGTGSIHVSLSSRPDQLVVGVEDNGAGIPFNEQGKIFDKFYRGRNSTTKRGLGIGLYLVREIMNGNGGSVEVDSIVGHGSTFRLVFPVSNSLYARDDVTQRRAS